MADTYTQLYIYIVFAVKSRQALIPNRHKSELHQYITGIVTNRKQKMIQINSMPDHIHILVGITPDIAISDLVRDIIVKPENMFTLKEQQFREYTRSLARFPNLANVKLIVGFTIR